MATAAELQVKVTTSGAKQAASDLQGVDRAIKTTGQGAGQATAGLGKFEAALAGVAAGLTGQLVDRGLGLAQQAFSTLVDEIDNSIDAASDLNESMSKTQAVFKENSVEVVAWSETSATAFGQSKQQALEAASTFGNLFTAMGLTGDAASDMSTDLVELASDLASFNNIGTDEALLKLRAGLVGEAEPLRTLGVQLSAAAVEAKALELGLADTASELTNADKVMARYKIILEQTTTAQGDFGRTSDQLANQQRIQQAQMEDMRASIGEGLLPAMLALTSATNELVSSDAFQSGIKNFAGGLETWTGWAISATEATAHLVVVIDELSRASEQAGMVLRFVGDAAGYAAEGAQVVAMASNDVQGALGLQADAQKDVTDAYKAYTDLILQRGVMATEAARAAMDEMNQSIEDRAKLQAALVAAEVVQARLVEDLSHLYTDASVAGNDYDRMVLAATPHTYNFADAARDAKSGLDGITASGMRASMTMGDLAAVNDIMNQRIDDSANAISHWEGRVTDVDTALGYLDEQLSAGNITSEEHRAATEKLTEFQGRLAQGIEDDLIPGFIDSQLAAADLQRQMDDLNKAHDDGVISEQDYATAAAGIREEMEKNANPIGTLIEKVGDLIELLIELEGQDPEVTITANTDAIQNAIEAMREYAANNPINVPMYGYVAGGNDAVSYVPGGGAGGNDSTYGDQSGAWSHQRAGFDAGRNFGKGFKDGASSEFDRSPTFTDVGKEHGRDYGEGFDGTFTIKWKEIWLQAFDFVENLFVNDPMALFKGDAIAGLKEDIVAYEAYLGALVQAGFGPGTPMYDEAYAAYLDLMKQMEVAAAIAGTESAQDFWDEWFANLPREWDWPEARDGFGDAGEDWGEYAAERFWDGFASGIGRPGEGSGSIIDAILGPDGEPIGVPIEFDIKPKDGKDGEDRAFIEAVEQLGEDALAALEDIFSEYPDVAVGMIDDLIKAVVDGRIPFEDAMELLANVPEEDLIPALDALIETLNRDLAQALLKFGAGSPEVQAILDSLALIGAAAGSAKTELTDLQKSLIQGNSNITAVPGATAFDGAGSGGGPQPVLDSTGFNEPSANAILAAKIINPGGIGSGITANAANWTDLSDWIGQFAGQGYKLAITPEMVPNITAGWGANEWMQIKDLYLPGGVTSPGGVAFRGGGFTLGEGLAMLHPNEAVINPNAQIVQPIADAIVNAMSGGGGKSGPITINLTSPMDGRVLKQHVVTIMNNESVRTI